MKKNICLILLVACSVLLPHRVDAASLNVSVSCKDVTLNQTVTCSINGNSGGTSISAIHGEYSVSGGASVQSFKVGSGWGGEGSGGSFDLDTDANKKGSFQIGTITLKGTKVGKVTLTLKGFKVADQNFNSIGAVGNASASFYVKEATTTTKTTKKQNVTSNIIPSTSSTTTTISTLPVLKLTSVTVDNFEVKYENDIYYATVTPETEFVNINATAPSGIEVVGTGKRNLAVGKNSVELVLRNQANQTNTVQVIVTRPEGGVTDTKLSSLKVVDQEIKFNPDVKEYTISVPSNTKEIYVIAKSASDDVIITGDGLKTLGRGEDTVYIKVSYGDLATTEYVIHVKKNHQMLYMWIGIGTLGIGCIGLFVLALKNKKVATNKAVAEKNKVLAEANRQEAATSPTAGIALNGEKVVDVGRRTVVPTKVIHPNKPADSVTPAAPVTPTPPAPTPEVPVAPIQTNVQPQVQMVNTAPDAQVKLVKKTVVTHPKNVRTIHTKKTVTPEGIMNQNGVVIKNIEK